MNHGQIPTARLQTKQYSADAIIGNLQKLLSDMEDTTWNHGGDREAANVGYRVTSEKTFQAAKAELAVIVRQQEMAIK